MSMIVYFFVSNQNTHYTVVTVYLQNIKTIYISNDTKTK